MNLRKWVVKVLVVVVLVCGLLSAPASTSAGTFTIQLTCSQAQQIVANIDAFAAEIQEYINSGVSANVAEELTEFLNFLDMITDEIQAKFGSTSCVIPD